MHHPPPIRILLDITVRADAPPLPERPIPPRPPLREADEVVALRWLRQTGQYAGLKANLGYAWYMLFVNRLKQPCGRVEMQGSQQHIFELILPSKEAALELLRPAFHGVIAHPNLKFLVDPVTREAQWRASKSTDTYRVEDAYQLGEYLALHKRQAEFQLDKHLMLYDGSKLAPISKKSGLLHASVMITFIPPLTLELVRRRRPKVWVLKAELNSQVVNDLGGQTLPPHYEYGEDMDLEFKELALYHLEGMRKRGHPLSNKFLTILKEAEPQRRTDYTDDSESEEEAEPDAARHLPPSDPVPLPPSHVPRWITVVCAHLLHVCCQDGESEPESGSGDDNDGGEWRPMD